MFDSAPTGVLIAMDEAAAASPSMIQYVVLFGAVAAIMYFFIFLPQSREKKAHDALISSLARDDRVILHSGIHGKVVSVAGATLILEIAEKTHITVERGAVARKADIGGDKPDAQKK